MKLILLPGNSKSNKEWSEAASQAFSGVFKDIYIHHYSHWDNGQDSVDFDVEAKNLSEIIGLNDCVIIAKSAGAMLAMYCVYKNLLTPQKCIFVGLPVLWAKEKKIDLGDWIQGYNVPTIIIQNSDDPITSYDEMKSFIEKFNKQDITLVEVVGNNHKYDDFEMLKLKAEEFFR
jgi:hypothetical protein